MKDPRQQAVLVLLALYRGEAIPAAACDRYFVALDEQARSFAQHLIYAVVRHHFRLHAWLNQLLQRPLKSKDRDIQVILLLGISQLAFSQVATHAAVYETVELVRKSRKSWATGLVNAILRRFLKQKTMFQGSVNTASDEIRYEHPAWFIQKVQSNWPEQWQHILDINQTRAPMTLRIHLARQSRQAYSVQLKALGIAHQYTALSQAGIQLEQPMPMETLPGFHDGCVSVQDEAAQYAVELLAVQENDLVLDACCAPGNKTCHILESVPSARVVAVDIDAQRMTQLQYHLKRLQLQAECYVQSAQQFATQWSGSAFDRILLDAPCTASGVIRRHPDIRLLRRPEDSVALAAEQNELFSAVWQCLKPGGILLYVTCSIFSDENEATVQSALERQPDAVLLNHFHDSHTLTSLGCQLLPRMDGHDGFYYAVFKKLD